MRNKSQLQRFVLHLVLLALAASATTVTSEVELPSEQRRQLASFVHHEKQLHELEQYFRLPSEEKKPQAPVHKESEAIHQLKAESHQHKISLEEQRQVLILSTILAVLGGVLLTILCVIGVYCFREQRSKRRQFEKGYRNIFYKHKYAPQVDQELGQEDEALFVRSKEKKEIEIQDIKFVDGSQKSTRVWSMNNMRDTVKDPSMQMSFKAGRNLQHDDMNSTNYQSNYGQIPEMANEESEPYRQELQYQQYQEELQRRYPAEQYSLGRVAHSQQSSPSASPKPTDIAAFASIPEAKRAESKQQVEQSMTPVKASEAKSRPRSRMGSNRQNRSRDRSRSSNAGGEDGLEGVLDSNSNPMISFAPANPAGHLVDDKGRQDIQEVMVKKEAQRYSQEVKEAEACEQVAKVAQHENQPAQLEQQDHPHQQVEEEKQDPPMNLANAPALHNETQESSKETPKGSRIQGSFSMDSPDIRVSRVELEEKGAIDLEQQE